MFLFQICLEISLKSANGRKNKIFYLNQSENEPFIRRLPIKDDVILKFKFVWKQAPNRSKADRREFHVFDLNL